MVNGVGMALKSCADLLTLPREDDEDEMAQEGDGNYGTSSNMAQRITIHLETTN